MAQAIKSDSNTQIFFDNKKKKETTTWTPEETRVKNQLRSNMAFPSLL